MIDHVLIHSAAIEPAWTAVFEAFNNSIHMDVHVSFWLLILLVV